MNVTVKYPSSVNVTVKYPSSVNVTVKFGVHSRLLPRREGSLLQELLLHRLDLRAHHVRGAARKVVELAADETGWFWQFRVPHVSAKYFLHQLHLLRRPGDLLSGAAGRSIVLLHRQKSRVSRGV